ncbi:arginine synthesis PII-interacting regulator PirA [Anabaena sp. WFMT]|uniref:arginine synthesis PII-interacting regulator PirA n=1 Tax=Anabaena sp. WFMT TaxID=3449730 RepID=UPI003F23F939
MSSNRAQVARKTEEAHKENIQKTLKHRLEVARLKGDENLIGQLEAEMASYS